MQFNRVSRIQGVCLLFAFTETSLWLTKFVLLAEDDVAAHLMKLCGAASV